MEIIGVNSGKAKTNPRKEVKLNEKAFSIGQSCDEGTDDRG